MKAKTLLLLAGVTAPLILTGSVTPDQAPREKSPAQPSKRPAPTWPQGNAV